ncbi:phosphotransferase [Microlunatus endophyticus]|uniref:Phosphotransferase n=1 Tax=Microlunatus endophyticus TaxID=1716077 RepID=A0A917W834_9ACTN|nr:aminoglycoside phosphotransferase family protein [Microlunatus endophyticus]GGL76989.1 phosphotransferase [Microlunatus endophyticus]
MEHDVGLTGIAAEQWPDHDWPAAEVLHGAFHVVMIPPGDDVVLRVVTGRGFDARCTREVGIVRTLAATILPLPVPKLLADPITTAEWSAYLVSRLPGRPLDTEDSDPVPTEDYRQILYGFAQLDPSRLADLPTPRSWCGGDEWPGIVEHDLVPLLPPEARQGALRAIDDLLAAELPASQTFCHGDFGPHNILWQNRMPTGLIDCDHACLGDRAIDVAPLISWHGVRALEAVFDRTLLRRAMTHRATLSLQVAAAAHLVDSTALRDHALGNFTQRLESGRLYDPQGRQPADLRPV